MPRAFRERPSGFSLKKTAIVLCVLAAVVWALGSGLIGLLVRIAWLVVVTGSRG